MLVELRKERREEERRESFLERRTKFSSREIHFSRLTRRRGRPEEEVKCFWLKKSERNSSWEGMRAW